MRLASCPVCHPVCHPFNSSFQFKCAKYTPPCSADKVHLLALLTKYIYSCLLRERREKTRAREGWPKQGEEVDRDKQQGNEKGNRKEAASNEEEFDTDSDEEQDDSQVPFPCASRPRGPPPLTLCVACCRSLASFAWGLLKTTNRWFLCNMSGHRGSCPLTKYNCLLISAVQRLRQQ